MLVRYTPFGEWVNIYYNPKEISEDQMLARIRSNGCPNSRKIRGEQANIIMNPYIGAGDTVQLRLNSAEAQEVEILGLPNGWAIDGELKRTVEAGETYINIRTPVNARSGKYKLKVKPQDGPAIDYSTTVVSIVR